MDIDEFEDFDKFDDHMEFGETFKSSSLMFAKVRDLNLKDLYVPYHNETETLTQLLASYKDVTHCKDMIGSKTVYLKNPKKNIIY
jgi:hypothetical protein